MADNETEPTGPETTELTASIGEAVSWARFDRISMARSEGLALAVELHAALEHARAPFDSHPVPARVIDTAGQFAAWLLAKPHRLALRPAPFTFQQPAYPGPAIPTKTGADDMGVALTDTQEVTYTVAAEDSKGFPVSDTLTWASDDNGAVVTVTPSADGTSCVFAAVAPGTANISVTDGTLSAADAITVSAGGVAQLVLTPGTPAGE